MDKKTTRIVLLLVSVAVAGSGCATYFSSMREANELFRAGDYDKAVQLLEAEITSHPKNSEIKAFLYRAKLNSYYAHVIRARERIAASDRESAKKEYQIALAIFPGNSHLKEEMDANLAEKPKAEVAKKSSIEPPVHLAVSRDAKFELTIFNTPITNIFKALGKNFNINFIFDREFREFIHSVDIKNKNFFEMLNMLCMVSNADYRIVDPTTVLIYPDQPYKRQLFDLKAIKTFYLGNIKAEDAKKILMPLFTTAAQGISIQEDPNLNSLIVKADIGTLTEIEKFLPNIDIPKSEVEINIDIIEINRVLIQKLGIQYGAPLLSAQLSTTQPETGKTIPPIKISDLGSSEFYITVPSAALNLLEADDNNKIIAKPNLRGLDGEKISYMVGDEVPIPQTQFQGFAAGGVNTVPMTTYQYKNVGVEIKITPSIHHNNEITLETELTISFLTGSGFTTEFPVLGKREIKAKFRLKENETNIIGGFIRDDIRGTLSGLPVLSRLPLLGKLFGSTEDTIRQTDLIFSITPRIIRRLPLREKNLEPIWLNMEQKGTGATEGPPPGPSRERPGMTVPLSQPPQQRNSLSITPAQTRIPMNGEATFSVSVQSEAPIQTLALRGMLAGSGEITDLKADFFDNTVKVMKYASGNSFDAGYTFSDVNKSLRNSVVLQVKVKCSARGNFTFTVECSSALDTSQKSVNLPPASARIEVY